MAPAAAVLVILFGGESITPCLALNCPGPTAIPGQIPIIGTRPGMFAALLVSGVAWFLASFVIVADLQRNDPHRLRRLSAGIVAVGSVAVALGFALGAQVRLREGAEQAVLFGFASMLICLIVGLGWAGLTRRVAPTAHPAGGPDS